MGKFIDLTGQIFGDFKITSFDDTRGKYKYYWNGECIHCCNKKSIASSRLHNNEQVRCDVCNKDFGKSPVKGYAEDLTGKRFGELTVTGFAYNKNDHSYWYCDCSCGNQVIKSIGFLHRGLNQMCDECIDKHREDIKKILDYGIDEIEDFNPIITHRGKKKNSYIDMGDYVIVNDGIYMDTHDFKIIEKFDRYISVNSGGYAYFRCSGRDVFVHRLIMGLPVSFDGENDDIAEHIDGNRKNNRRNNLRICEKKINPINCGIYSNNTSGHKGVSWLERLQKYQAYLQCGKTKYYLGVYSSYDDAVKAREDAEKKYFGEFNRDKEHLYNVGAGGST